MSFPSLEVNLELEDWGEKSLIISKTSDLYLYIMIWRDLIDEIFYLLSEKHNSNSTPLPPSREPHIEFFKTNNLVELGKIKNHLNQSKIKIQITDHDLTSQKKAFVLRLPSLQQYHTLFPTTNSDFHATIFYFPQGFDLDQIKSYSQIVYDNFKRQKK